MPSPWGAALESLGSGLMKFGMMKMDQEQDLEKEARADARLLASEERAYQRALDLQKAKDAMEEAKKLRIAEQQGRTIAAARERGAATATTKMQESLGLLGLGRESFDAWAKTPAPEKTTYGANLTLAGLSEEDRDIYEANLREQMGAVKPSQGDIDKATLRDLLATNPDVAEAYMKPLETEARIANLLAPKAETGKVHVSMTADGRVLKWDDTGRYTLEGKPKGTGAKELTQAQLSNNAEIETARKQVRLWQEKGETAEALSADPAKAKALAKALQRKVGTDPDYDLYHAHLGQNMTQQELAARRQPAPTTATASKKLTLDQLNAARDDKQKEWAGKLAAKKITQAQYDDYMAKLKTGYDAEVAKLK